MMATVANSSAIFSYPKKTKTGTIRSEVAQMKTNKYFM